MKSGNPEGGALMHVPLCRLHIQQEEQGNNYFNKERHFHIGILSPAFKKSNENPPCPSNNTLTTTCHQQETTTTSNSSSSPMNFCSKQPSPPSET